MQVDEFLEQFRSIACNFQWNHEKNSLVARKFGREFDPTTALVWISKREFIDRTKITEISAALEMSPTDFSLLMRALYNPDFSKADCMNLRIDLERACDLYDYEEAT